MVTTYIVLGNLVNDGLLVYSQGLQLQNWIFFVHHLTWYNSALTILHGPKSVCLAIQFSFCSYFAPACDFNTLQRKKIPQNISPGKISNILTMPFRYCGQNKHFMNWIQIKSFYYTKILLISYLQYKSYVTGVIFTM